MKKLFIKDGSVFYGKQGKKQNSQQLFPLRSNSDNDVMFFCVEEAGVRYGICVRLIEAQLHIIENSFISDQQEIECSFCKENIIYAQVFKVKEEDVEYRYRILLCQQGTDYEDVTGVLIAEAKCGGGIINRVRFMKGVYILYFNGRNRSTYEYYLVQQGKLNRIMQTEANRIINGSKKKMKSLTLKNEL